MGWCTPGEKANEAVLEDEDDANAWVEAAEVVGHQREAEGWTGDIIRRTAVDRCRGSNCIASNIFGWYDLLENPEG